MQSRSVAGKRVLVVGAGIAGLTVARLLRRQGLHPVVIDRAAPDSHPGYMLALMPLVDPAITALGLREHYRDASVELDRYLVRDRHARPIRQYSMAGLLGRYGSYCGISRAALVDLLAPSQPVRHRTAVSALHQDERAVHVRLRTAEKEVDATFDLVVAADGLHSATRSLILRPEQVSAFESGWGGWVAWAAPDADLDRCEELWGAGFFVGTYPVRDRVGVFLGGPCGHTEAGPEQFTAGLRAALPRLDARLGSALGAVGEASYFWPLNDRRAETWAVGRCILLGDAAAGFLPTAGIGAGMAIESAMVLATYLDGVTPEAVPAVLKAYERAQRPRVVAAQSNSRRLARLMFRRSPSLAAVRDTASRFVSLRAALRPITRLLRTAPPSPSRSQ